MSRRLLVLIVLLAPATASRAHAQCASEYIAVSTTDLFTSSSISTIDPVTKIPATGLQSLFGLGYLRAFGSRTYVVNDSGKIQILDPCNSFHETQTAYTLAPTADLRDIYVTPSNFGYVTQYGVSTLAKINLTGGGVFYINLGGTLADADGNPEMNQMFVVGNRLYVTLERVNHTTGVPAATSYLAVIDLTTDAVIDMDPIASGNQGIPLVLNRPASEINLRHHNGAVKAYFSAVGALGVMDGGVIECDASDPTQQSVLLTELNAGGDIGDVEIISDTKGFAILLLPGDTYQLIAFNPSTGLKIGATMFSVSNPGNDLLGDIEPSSLGLLLSHFKLFGAGSGIRCFDMATNAEIPGGPVNVGLPPYDILVRHGTTSAVGETPTSYVLSVSNYPNPFNPRTTVRYTAPSPGEVKVQIYDARGAIVKTLFEGHRVAGAYSIDWDGRADNGDAVASGLYFARIEHASGTRSKKMVLLK